MLLFGGWRKKQLKTCIGSFLFLSIIRSRVIHERETSSEIPCSIIFMCFGSLQERIAAVSCYNRAFEPFQVGCTTHRLGGCVILFCLGGASTTKKVGSSFVVVMGVVMLCHFTIGEHPWSDPKSVVSTSNIWGMLWGHITVSAKWKTCGDMILGFLRPQLGLVLLIGESTFWLICCCFSSGSDY